MPKYLYGASIQGIQNFILQTNKLREIAGASELVQYAVTDLFAKQIGVKDLSADTNAIVNAAGKVSYIFEDEDLCKKCVLEFPTKVMDCAPGITISQAVVAMTGEYASYEAASGELETRLKVQRNHRAKNSTTTGIMGIARSRQTGLPAVIPSEKENRYTNLRGYDKYIDAATIKKLSAVDLKGLCIKAFGEDEIVARRLPFEIEEITGINNWIAVIHADGNGLGKVVTELHGNEKRMKDFSRNLEAATVASAREAYKAVKENFEKDEVIPIRPVVLGGDDLTVICRGDIAIKYVSEFMRAFEQNSKTIVPEGLTACAGVSFVKASFPFYYGYELAESLCGESKKIAKEMMKERNLSYVPSCLMFHKVQDSFIEDFATIKESQLTVDGGGTFCFGPYFVSDNIPGYFTVEELIDKSSAKTLGDDGIRSGIRKWITAMHEDRHKAQQLLQRMLEINKSERDNCKAIIALTQQDEIRNAYAAANILDLNAILTKPTKK